METDQQAGERLAAESAPDEHPDWYQALMARLDQINHNQAQQDAMIKDAAARARKIMQQQVRPWWAPDAQGFVIASIIAIVAVALFWRMTHASEVNDKLLDMMLTILFGTALVGIINYLFGSSRGSAAKDEVQSKMIDKLAPQPPPASNGDAH